MTASGALSFALGLLLLATIPGAAASGPFPRTAPSDADPPAIALSYLAQVDVSRGGAPDGAAWVLTDRHRNARTGTTHLYLRRQLGGIDVYNHTVAIALDAEGRLAVLKIPELDPEHALSRRRAPTLSALTAVERAATRLGLRSAPGRIVRETHGPDRAVTIDAPGLSPDPIAARLVYVERPGALRLAWHFDLRLRDARFWWELNVDADTGALLTRRNRVRNDQYRVFAQPVESPENGPRTLEIDPADPNASPLGWHDTDGVPGPEFTNSQGNNALAAENASMGPIINFAEGGPMLDFDFAFDPNAAPASNADAAVTNLFYWTNWLHDLHLHYGFDEAAGNFQEFHYLPDPNGSGDSVTAFVQDFNDVNNASMATPADGSSPVLRMHLFSVPVLRVSAPEWAAGGFEAGGAEFGPALTPAGTSGSVVIALDPNDPNGRSTTDACSPITNASAVLEKIALVDRGSCNFIDKVDHAEAAGAIAVIVADNVEGSVFTMSKPQGQTPKIDVPSMLVRRDVGASLVSALADGNSPTVMLLLSERDSGFDSGVIIHEYGHGVSTRLTGGPSNASCLLAGQAAGMGEGWSDFWALALTALPSDTGPDARTVGAYLVGVPGIRNFPYSTDLDVNPQTFIDVSTTNAPHGIGEIWALALWELYWLLVEELGFDALVGGSGGNNVALQLAMDALKLQPCDPSFVDARDAVLLADTLSGGTHACSIWRAFAKRGLGDGADAVPDPNGLVGESFALPSACPLCGDANVDGLIDPNDVTLIQTELAFPGTLTPGQISDCSDRALSGSCGLLETVIVRRGLLGLPPGLSGPCTAAP